MISIEFINCLNLYIVIANRINRKIFVFIVAAVYHDS